MEESTENDNLTLEVTIPENSVAGDKITIQCPDHNYVEFVTPANVVAGDTVHVMVADSKDIESSTEHKDNSENVDVVESPEKVEATKPKGGGYQGVAAVTTVRVSSTSCFTKQHQLYLLCLFPIIHLNRE